MSNTCRSVVVAAVLMVSVACGSGPVTDDESASFAAQMREQGLDTGQTDSQLADIVTTACDRTERGDSYAEVSNNVATFLGVDPSWEVVDTVTALALDTGCPDLK